MYTRNMVCLRYIFVNALHKGENKIIIIIFQGGSGGGGNSKGSSSSSRRRSSRSRSSSYLGGWDFPPENQYLHVTIHTKQDYHIHQEQSTLCSLLFITEFNL